jgi:hypothetical protein
MKGVGARSTASAGDFLLFWLCLVLFGAVFVFCQFWFMLVQGVDPLISVCCFILDHNVYLLVSISHQTCLMFG